MTVMTDSAASEPFFCWLVGFEGGGGGRGCLSTCARSRRPTNNQRVVPATFPLPVPVPTNPHALITRARTDERDPAPEAHRKQRGDEKGLVADLGQQDEGEGGEEAGAAERAVDERVLCLCCLSVGVR